MSVSRWAMIVYLTGVNEIVTMQTSTEITRKPYSLLGHGFAVGIKRGLGAERLTIQPNVTEQIACRFFLLGPFAVIDRQGNVITPKAQKTCAMLAMLILSPRATRTRVWLRDKLWSDRSEGQGAASLRQALLDARRSLGELGCEVILADKKSISLDLTKITLDTDGLLSSEHQLTSDREELERALNEDLLEGMDIRDPEFEDWLTLERQVWQRRVTQQLESESTVAPIVDQQSELRNTGQKIVTTTLIIRLGNNQRPTSSAQVNDCIARVRDACVDSGGRIFDIQQQHVSIEFQRPHDAVRFAMIVSRSLNELLESPLSIGIGINSGLVYRDHNRLYGTEVDIAFAASNNAHQHTVMITEATATLVQGKIDYQLSFGQECSVSDMAGPIRLFAVTDGAAKQVSSELEQAMSNSFSGTDGPSIGVLPFRVADDSVHEYMSEGLADDIILALSNNHWLNVISRNSSFSYQYDSANSKMVANQLKVNYIVGGTVKVLNSVITIIVTLESVTSNCIIWSESFSVKMTEIMHLQERIATKVTAHLLQELGKHEQVRAYESRIDDLTTWQLVHRGHWHMTRRTSTGVARARNLYQRALDRDEYQSDALVALAWWHFWKAWSEHGIGETDYDLDQSMRLCRRALLMDRSDGRVHAYLGAIAIMRNQASNAVGFFDEAIRLNPSLSFAYSSRGSANLLLGKPELAPADICNALALNPADYYRFHSLSELAAAYYFSSDLDKAIEAAESSSFLAPRYWYARLIKIACLITRDNAGDRQAAAKEKVEITNREINVSDEKIRAIPFINRQYNERLIEIYKEV
jgi:adenylate cyclase